MGIAHHSLCDPVSFSYLLHVILKLLNHTTFVYWYIRLVNIVKLIESIRYTKSWETLDIRFTFFSYVMQTWKHEWTFNHKKKPIGYKNIILFNQYNGADRGVNPSLPLQFLLSKMTDVTVNHSKWLITRWNIATKQTMFYFKLVS